MGSLSCRANTGEFLLYKATQAHWKNAWSFSKSYSSRATEELYEKDFPFKMTPERKRGSSCSDRALF